MNEKKRPKIFASLKKFVELARKMKEVMVDYDNLHLQEMANVRKKQTGLPVNIWIDEAETYKKRKIFKTHKISDG